jgi:hypothetical protein
MERSFSAQAFIETGACSSVNEYQRQYEDTSYRSSRAGKSANVRNPNQHRVAGSAAQDSAHSMPIKHHFAKEFHCAAAPAGHFSGRHLKRKNLFSNPPAALPSNLNS